MEYLGHTICLSGIKKTTDYLAKLSNYPQPKNIGELFELWGFINLERKFLPNCSEIQKPLSCLTGSHKNKSLLWTVEMSDSFGKLKGEIMRDVELACPDYTDVASKLELWVVALAYGSGAYLAQQQNGVHRIIGFASMTFT